MTTDLQALVKQWREQAARTKLKGNDWCDGASAFQESCANELEAVVTACLDQQEKTAKAWICFHCDEMFTDEAEAREHFGLAEDSDPACRLRVKEFRRLEAEVARLRASDQSRDYDAEAYHGQSSELERLFGARTAYGAWLKLEAMESRAMAAEEQLAAVLPSSPEDQPELVGEPEYFKVKGWRNIETAPKDGSWVLCFGTLWTLPVVGCWSRASNCWQDMNGSLHQITHWMPLPEPPLALTQPDAPVRSHQDADGRVTIQREEPKP